MFVTNIDRGIQISIEAVATYTTEEERLGPTIIPRLMPTLTAHLRGVSWINLDHLNPTCLSLVAQEVVKLSKAPSVHVALPFTFLVGDTLANISQVLKHDGTTWSGTGNDAFREDMVMVSALPKQFTR
jgi:hypothetical protein